MSVEDLRARILKLESEIELQKQLLKKLEQDKSLAQGQINAVLDPVARLPLEISSEIFLQSVAQHVPIALLNICNAWTNIALATPALWTAVHIHFPCGDGLAEVLPIWFQRARNRPLSITISLQGRSSNWNHRVSAVLWKYQGQLKHLEILDDDDFETAYYDFEMDDEEETLDLFENTALVSLPLLETLTIRCQHQRRNYRASQILQLLRQAPNLVECAFGFQTYPLDLPSFPKIVLPAIRRLDFGENNDSDDSLLSYLSLPALETLSLPMSSITGEELVAFIEKSPAPLQDLALGSYRTGILPPVPVHECLGYFPSLTRLRLWDGPRQIMADLFAAMADSSLLPNLRDLNITFTVYEVDISDPSWRLLVSALSTRRMQLRVVPVCIPPPADVLASFRKLARGGVGIYVGDEKRNFVVA